MAGTGMLMDGASQQQWALLNALAAAAAGTSPAAYPAQPAPSASGIDAAVAALANRRVDPVRFPGGVVGGPNPLLDLYAQSAPPFGGESTGLPGQPGFGHPGNGHGGHGSPPQHGHPFPPGPVGPPDYPPGFHTGPVGPPAVRPGGPIGPPFGGGKPRPVPPITGPLAQMAAGSGMGH